MALLDFTEKGIYCPQADVYLDPWKPVRRALISHGHSDHARWGNDHYLCTTAAAPVIRHRLPGANVETAPYGLCNCAERTAIFSAITAGERKIRAVVVYTPTRDATMPCGALPILGEAVQEGRGRFPRATGIVSSRSVV